MNQASNFWEVVIGLLRDIKNAGGGGGLPKAAGAGITSATTSTTGSNFVPLPNGGCNQLEIYNYSNADIEYRRFGTGPAFPIAAKDSRMIVGVSNPADISIRRVDQSNTPVTVAVEVFL
jgi:hypothetical protein